MGRVSGIMHAIERLYTEIKVEEESVENAMVSISVTLGLTPDRINTKLR